MIVQGIFISLFIILLSHRELLLGFFFGKQIQNTLSKTIQCHLCTVSGLLKSSLTLNICLASKLQEASTCFFHSYRFPMGAVNFLFWLFGLVIEKRFEERWLEFCSRASDY